MGQCNILRYSEDYVQARLEENACGCAPIRRSSDDARPGDSAPVSLPLTQRLQLFPLRFIRAHFPLTFIAGKVKSALPSHDCGQRSLTCVAKCCAAFSAA